MTVESVQVYHCDRCHKQIEDKKHVHSVTVNVQMLEGGYPGVHFKWNELCPVCHKAGLVYFREALK